MPAVTGTVVGIVAGMPAGWTRTRTAAGPVPPRATGAATAARGRPRCDDARGGRPSDWHPRAISARRSAAEAPAGIAARHRHGNRCAQSRSARRPSGLRSGAGGTAGSTSVTWRQDSTGSSCQMSAGAGNRCWVREAIGSVAGRYRVDSPSPVRRHPTTPCTRRTRRGRPANTSSPPYRSALGRTHGRRRPPTAGCRNRGRTAPHRHRTTRRTPAAAGSATSPRRTVPGGTRAIGSSHLRPRGESGGRHADFIADPPRHEGRHARAAQHRPDLTGGVVDA